MMECDKGTQLARSVSRKERVERALRAESHALPRKLFYLGYELRIERHAGLAQRHERNRTWSFRGRRQDTSACPRCFASRLALIEHTYAQAGLRKFQRDRAADQTAAGHRHVQPFHAFILAHPRDASRHRRIRT